MTKTELRQYIDKVLGNSIRCLLPSYWWKRLFSQVADRIDEVEQSALELVEASKMPIVGSEAALKRLDVEDGNLASVLGMETRERSFGELYQLSFQSAILGNYTNCTEVKDIITKAPSLDGSVVLMFGTADGSRVFDILVAGAVMGVTTHENKELNLYVNGVYYQEGHDYLREELSSFQYKYIIGFDYCQDGIAPLLNYDLIDPFLTCVATLPEADVYVKGNTWERLAKAGESGGSSGGDITVDSSLSTTSTNPVQNKVVTNALNNKQTTLVSGTNIKTINGTSILGSGDLKIDMLGAIVSRDLYAVGLKYGQTGGVITELTSEMKDYNKVTKQLFLEGKADVRIVYVRDGIVETFPVWHYFNYYDSFYFVEPFDHVSSSTRLQMEIHRVRVEDDGTATWERYRIAPDKEVIADSYNAVSGKAVKAYVDGKIAEIPVVTVDSELSDTSENPIQNKVIKAYVDELNARLKTLEEQLKTVI